MSGRATSNARVVTRTILTVVYAGFAVTLCLRTLAGPPDVVQGLVTVPLALLGAAGGLVALERILERTARPRVGRRPRGWRAGRWPWARVGRGRRTAPAGRTA